MPDEERLAELETLRDYLKVRCDSIFLLSCVLPGLLITVSRPCVC